MLFCFVFVKYFTTFCLLCQQLFYLFLHFAKKHNKAAKFFLFVCGPFSKKALQNDLSALIQRIDDLFLDWF